MRNRPGRGCTSILLHSRETTWMINIFEGISNARVSALLTLLQHMLCYHDHGPALRPQTGLRYQTTEPELDSHLPPEQEGLCLSQFIKDAAETETPGGTPNHGCSP